MKNLSFYLLFSIIFFISCSTKNLTKDSELYYKNYNNDTIEKLFLSERNIESEEVRLYTFDIDQLNKIINQKNKNEVLEIYLPNWNESIKYKATVRSNMSEALQSQYPFIKSWTGINEGLNSKADIDYNGSELNAMISNNDGTYIIETYIHKNTKYLALYKKILNYNK